MGMDVNTVLYDDGSYKKYDKQDPKYIERDDNGWLHLTDEGKTKVISDVAYVVLDSIFSPILNPQETEPIDAGTEPIDDKKDKSLGEIVIDIGTPLFLSWLNDKIQEGKSGNKIIDG